MESCCLGKNPLAGRRTRDASQTYRIQKCTQFLVRKPEGKRPLERPKHRHNNIKIYPTK